jgi:serine/threonine protein kinase
MAKNCPKCKSENPADSKFCKECGTQINSQSEIPVSSTMTLPPDELKHELKDIGPYKILEEIGSGGMGTVHLAQQEKPIKRKVAIKVIKPGMDSKEVIARFESEQQALALMSHPNIAQVHDSGITADGYPYFVMEYVPGRPITEHCDKHKMTIYERLTLFEKVCDAVQHAHFRGIIHRDIKPTNVLVSYQDKKHVPKIIDFGLAKALTGQDLTEKTLHTLHGIGVGTPTYMSPEQTELTSYDVDTRTDVYSLGVLLYELLVGRTPFEIVELERAGVMEILRIIREEDPPKPSTRFSSLGEASTTIIKTRKTSSVEMIRRLKGDLDIIVMKTLEKDRIRRYETANSLAMDIKLYLKNEPILARPPSAGYRLGKFIRRHKAGVAAAALAILAFAVGLTGLTVGLKEAVKAKNEAIQQAARVEAINEFLNSMLSSPDPGKKGRDVKVIDILDSARDKITGSFEDKPEIEASVRHTLGETYEAIGVYTKSISELEAALNIQERVLGADHPDTLNTMNSLSTVFIRLGRYEDAESLLLETITIQKDVFGVEHPNTIVSMQNLGVVYYYQKKYKESEAIGHETLKIRKQVLGEDHQDVIFSLENLAIALSGQKKHKEAEKVYLEARDKASQILGLDHPQTLRIMHNLALELKHSQDFEKAESLLIETLERQKQVFGPEHPDTIITMANFADLLNQMQRFREAADLAREALDLEKRVFGNEHPLTKMTQNILDEATKAVEKR